MATADQIKTLIQSHYEGNEDRFRTVVLHLAAYEANQGHTVLARDLRKIVDKGKNKANKVVLLNNDINELILISTEVNRLSELVVAEKIRTRVERVIREYRHRDKLRKHGMANRRKILLVGPPGTGKTMTASVLAGELHLPFCLIMMDKMVTKFMGETSVKLRQIFETIAVNQAIYLFDEFDAIGTERSRDNDVGEMRRVLNSFLQFIEQDNSLSLIVAATNNHELLDQALFRRFDDVIHYQLPGDVEIRCLIQNRLGKFLMADMFWEKIIKKAQTLSHAEITKACDDAIKEVILCDQIKVDEELLIKMIDERNAAYSKGVK